MFGHLTQQDSFIRSLIERKIASHSYVWGRRRSRWSYLEQITEKLTACWIRNSKLRRWAEMVGDHSTDKNRALKYIDEINLCSIVNSYTAHLLLQWWVTKPLCIYLRMRVCNRSFMRCLNLLLAYYGSIVGFSNFAKK